MADSRVIWGSEHICVKRACAAGAIVGGQAFLEELSRQLNHPEVPQVHRYKMLAGTSLYLDIASAMPQSAAASPTPPSSPSPTSNDDFLDYMEEPPVQVEPEHPVRIWLDRTLANIPAPFNGDGSPLFFVKLGKPQNFNEQIVGVALTAVFRVDNTEWNMNGTLADDRTPLNKYDVDRGVLLFDGDRRLNASKDFEAVFKGRQVKGAMFLWALQYVPDRTLRMWFNEKVGGTRKDILSQRFKMTPKGVVKLSR